MATKNLKTDGRVNNIEGKTLKPTEGFTKPHPIKPGAGGLLTIPASSVEGHTSLTHPHSFARTHARTT